MVGALASKLLKRFWSNFRPERRTCHLKRKRRPEGRRYIAQSKNGTPNGTRTRVSAVKGQRPRPLDDGRTLCVRVLLLV